MSDFSPLWPPAEPDVVPGAAVLTSGVAETGDELHRAYFFFSSSSSFLPFLMTSGSAAAAPGVAAAAAAAGSSTAST
jgi:hypothetical protein